MRLVTVTIPSVVALLFPMIAGAGQLASAEASNRAEAVSPALDHGSVIDDSPLPLSTSLLRSSAALEMFEEEPDIRQVQQWAVENARLSPFETSRLVRQARLRGALPTVRLHARYRSESATQWDELDLLERRDLDNDLSLNLWLEWDLAELAAGTDLARALRESRARLELRHAVVSQVTNDYFDRRLLRAEERLSEDDTLAVFLARRLRVQELDATLDGLTGGRWSRALRSEASESPGEDPNPGLRVPIHATDRQAGP